MGGTPHTQENSIQKNFVVESKRSHHSAPVLCGPAEITVAVVIISQLRVEVLYDLHLNVST